MYHDTIVLHRPAYGFKIRDYATTNILEERITDTISHILNDISII